MSTPSYSKNATVEHHDPSKPPVLTVGILTPEVVRTFELSCRQFFQQKSVPDIEQVQCIAWGMRDVRLQDWYLNDKDEIDQYSFPQFMTQLRLHWLEADWQSKIRMKVLGSRQGNCPFYEWAIDLQSSNAILRDDPAYLSLDQLRFQMEANMHPSLRTKCEHEKASTEKVFNKWVVLVKRLDEKRQARLLEQQQAIETYVRTKDTKKPFIRPTPTSTYSSAPNPSTFKRLPTLTIAERQLLREHNGCFKCRCFYSKHQSSSCPVGFPSADNYKPLTERDALAAKPSGSRSTVAAVTVDDVAAVIMPSAVLGEGSESDEYVAPFFVPHFEWFCHLSGPNVSSPLCVEALIDDGSHAVLIDAAIVSKLGLRRRRLPKPASVSVALGEKKSSFELTEYVKLSCTSTDSVWTSRVVRALITPQLCTPLLLGIPFLSHNKIVIDHESRSCVAKDSGYDLLHPTAHLPPPVHRPNADLLQKVVGVNVIVAIHTRIESLAAQEHLLRLDSDAKKKFADCFPSDIPHIRDLPDDILYRVRVTDANKVIQSRSYGCPRKYRDAW
ncbi:hypothetical protein BV22DRAFT_1026885, partial [Leucogyrophana mollusca]